VLPSKLYDYLKSLLEIMKALRKSFTSILFKGKGDEKKAE